MDERIYNNDDSGPHNKMNDVIMNDPETYEFVNGYEHNEEIIEFVSQKREILNNQVNEQNGLSDQSVLGEYIEITQEESDKKFTSIGGLQVKSSSLSENMEQTLTTLKSMSEEFNELNDQNKKLQSENNKLKEDNNNLLREKQSLEQNLASTTDYYETKIKNLELKLRTRIDETSVQKTHEQINDIIASLKSQLNDKENVIRDLKQGNINVKDELSKHHSTLRDATNVRLNNGQNDSVKLKQDILDLQRLLENYVTDLTSKVDINIKEVIILIEQYGCQKMIKSDDLDIPFIKAVLQRKALQQIFDLSKNYRKYKGENLSQLESDISLKAHELLDLIKTFSETRVGTNEVPKVAAVKIRQQIYEILGDHGFSDIISSQQNTFVHNFIDYSSQTLNEIMNQYRQINDPERKNEVEKLAPMLIRNALRIFWFCLMIQEPIPEIKFFESNAKINPDMMIGRWEEDKLDEACVDLCYFPLIGIDLNSNFRVITPAKILPRSIQNQLNAGSEQNKGEKNLSFVARILNVLK